MVWGMEDTLTVLGVKSRLLGLQGLCGHLVTDDPCGHNQSPATDAGVQEQSPAREQKPRYLKIW